MINKFFDKYSIQDDADAEYGHDYFVDIVDEGGPYCDVCGVSNDSVEYTIEPFDQEIYGVEAWLWMCADCYNESVMAV